MIFFRLDIFVMLDLICGIFLIGIFEWGAGGIRRELEYCKNLHIFAFPWYLRSLKDRKNWKFDCFIVSNIIKPFIQLSFFRVVKI